MSLKLIKTNKLIVCPKCKSKDFVRTLFSWVCYNCKNYIMPELKGNKK